MKWKNPFKTAKSVSAPDTETSPQEPVSDPQEPIPASQEPIPVPLEPGQLSCLKERYPALDEQALLDSRLFQAYAAQCGNDAEVIRMGFEDFVDGLVRVQSALEPPVSRVTGASTVHRSVPLRPEQRQALARWNREYPEYRMTEREYYRSIHED